MLTSAQYVLRWGCPFCFGPLPNLISPPSGARKQRPAMQLTACTGGCWSIWCTCVQRTTSCRVEKIITAYLIGSHKSSGWVRLTGRFAAFERPSCSQPFTVIPSPTLPGIYIASTRLRRRKSLYLFFKISPDESDITERKKYHAANFKSTAIQ